MSRYEEIKTLLEASRKALKTQISEGEIKQIKNSYSLITEQENLEKEIENVSKEYETANTDKEDSNDDETPNKSEKKKGYRISGGIMVIHSKESKDLQLTTEDKKAFQETMDEFVVEVSELVDFNKLNLYENNVEWSGKITELDVEFFYTIGEKNGVYVNGTMTKIDEEYLGFLVDLKKYYEKFKTKWSKIIASRKKTPVE
jgi:hypothetical protein